jgi:two-component system sensor histidine kinase KdpD
MKYSDSIAESAGARHKDSYEIFKRLWRHGLTKYLLAILFVGVAGLIMFYWNEHISYHSVSLIFLFVVSLLPILNFKPGPIFLAAVTSAFIWNYFFIPPAFTLRIGSVEDTMMYIMYFVIATVSSFLISRIRMQQRILDRKEKRTSSLYNLTKDLSAAKSLDEVTGYSVKRLRETFQVEAVFIYPEDEKMLSKHCHAFSSIEIDDGEWNYAQMVFLSSKKVGRFTDSASSITQLTYFPLVTKERKLGVAGIMFPEDSSFDHETDSFLNAFLTQISIAVEREHLKEITRQGIIISESEKLYKTLFDSVSHELKTPITTLLGAVSSFKEEKIIQNRRAFYRLIDEAAIATERLKRLVENLLDITRLESGVLKLKKDWHSIADLINSALNKLRNEGVDQKINYKIEDDTGLCFFDFPLIEQALINVIHNSAEYTPIGSMTDIYAEKNGGDIIISIYDNGKGFPEEELKYIFNKFYRVPGTKSGGLGLGLSIAKGFITAHGGTITAGNRKSGGAQFIIKLPVK